jgi:hypothetical protein
VSAAAAAIRLREASLARSPLLWAAPLLVATWLVTLRVPPWDDERITDLPLFRSLAADFLDGRLPYHGVDFEYPPLAAPLIALPGVGDPGADGYRLAFAAIMLAAGLVVLALACRLADAAGGSPALAAAGVALSPLLIGATIRNHFDLAAVALAAAALLLIARDRPGAGFAVLGLGALTKGFPLAIAPVALAWLWGRGDRRAAMRGGAALAATLAAGAALAAGISPAGAADAVAYHLERPVQIESVPATLVTAADAVGAGEAEVVTSHGSQGLEHPAAPTLAVAWIALGTLAVALLAARAAARPGPRELVLAGLAAATAFAAFGKVLSPQFLVWTIPLLALALAWRLRSLAAVTAGAMLLTAIEFPARYFDLVAREPLPVALVAVRDALLVAAVVLALRELTPPASGSARFPSRDPGRRRRRAPHSATGRPGRCRT